MNSVILIGRLTKDPELKYTAGSQTAVVKVSIAIDRIGKDKGADFPRITIFGKQAENVDRYCHKGSLVGVQGRLQTGSYDDKNGNKVYTTDVIADRVEFLSYEKKDSTPGETDLVAEPEDFEMLNEDVPF